MTDMPKNYDPSSNEERVLQKWLDGKFYSRSTGNDDRTIVIPPPNVTGMLHMGHALDDTIQDTYVRYCRMRGFSTRWIVGTDHAGIATQTKVDKKLKAQGIDRREIGREKFIEACREWKSEYGGIIVEQIKRMGCSVDFDDEKFTMSPEYERAVRKVFVDWYHDGLIYKGRRIVNWCPNCTTAISDDEAEYGEEAGHLWYLRYPLKEPVDGREYILVATTRPETMLGDTGVAIAPDDEEKLPLEGKSVILPIMDREIPIFTDWHVDKNFGTGFVKVTPAHDPNDYAMGQAHNLEQINIFDEHAVVVDGYGQFSGMTREQCREAVLKWFEEHDLLDHVEDITHSVMHCYRCDSTLEPWLSEQWFVAVDKLKGPATEVVKNGDVTFHPSRWTQTYLTWMENLKDWCISRQLWWGHRIPVFYCDACGWEDALMEDVQTCPHCGKPVHQDEDVLDTWFSSQLWTFATQGWPDNIDELAKHHPTKVLVTARDIIALWVARMVMSSLYFTGEIPFHDVFIYATILAKDGSRMSKSKGNGVDPMDLIHMYGADAMRYNLLTLVTGNQDVKFDANIDKKTKELIDSPRTDAARNFVNKIWNASRFCMMNLDGYKAGEPQIASTVDAWIFSRLAKLAASVTSGLEEYRFGDVARELYNFFWNEFCDWYIELSKSRLTNSSEDRLIAQRNLVFVLDTALRLLHPVMPFVTEAIWEKLPTSAGKPSLMVEQWPNSENLAHWVNEELEQSIQNATGIISAVRATRARYGISPAKELSIALRLAGGDAAKVKALIQKESELIASMAHLTEIEFLDANQPKPAESTVSLVGEIEAYIKLSGLVDFEAETARLKKDLAKAEKEFEKINKKLSNENFLAKAAPQAIEKARAQAAELETELKLLRAQLA